ncbi:MAG: polyprenyl synthetase family protein [Euryarchaeota archaeon]|nr:polyprenyl synthetase family protein [Euryarchaeota archaeon]
MELDGEFKPLRAKVDRELSEVLSDIVPERLRKASMHYPSAGGKRLRPIVAMLAAESVGGNQDDALPVGISLELIHNFSLVHDDIMDRDELRRGIKAVHVAFDEPTAILAGDTLYAKAFEELARVRAGSDTLVAILADVAAAARVICEGQQMDMEFEARAAAAESKDVDEDEYIEMVYRKTARLYECAAYAGGLVGGASRDQAQALGTFGKDFGIAFQIKDDLIDILGDEKKIGKPVGSDIRKGKRTIIFITARARSSAAGRKRLDAIVGNAKASDKEVQEVVGIFRSTGALEAAQKMVDEYAAEGRKGLMTLPQSDARRLLLSLSDYSCKRDA